MANDISVFYRLLLLLIFKILYFAQQIVPIEINPPSWADSCCDNSRYPPPCLSSRSRTKPRANPHQPAPSVVDPFAADLPPSNPRQSLRPASASATAELILYSSNSSSILGRRCPTFPTNIPYPSPLSLSFSSTLPLFFACTRSLFLFPSLFANISLLSTPLARLTSIVQTDL